MRSAGALAGAIALVLTATPAGAQQAEPIVVTGTRIPAAEPGVLEPVIVTRRQQLDDRVLTNVADALNDEPGTRGSITPAGSQNTSARGSTSSASMAWAPSAR